MLDESNKLPGEENNSEIENSSKAAKSKSKEVKETNKASFNEAIDEIETKIAESSEDVVHEEEEMLDYSNFNLEDLVAELGKLVKEKPVQSIQNNINQIKSIFNVKFGTLLKKEKEKFLAEGGNIVDFQYQNPIKTTYNSFLYDYKVKRNEFIAKQENQLKENLKAKLELIEELKDLIENADSTTMYKLFKDIQTKWREIGPIPRAKYNDTWRTYQHHVERFYDLLHLNNDLRELDFKHNLEEKLKLVEKAEELAEMEDVNLAFKELQVLHKLWKEEIGPVAGDIREEVWERFSEATKKVHDKRHNFYKDLKSKYEENVIKKIEVIEKIENFDTSKNKTRVDWQKSIDEIEMLRNKFLSFGRVPRSKSDDVWNRFKKATRKFNTEKNLFFKNVKKDHLDNLNRKKALVEKAVSLKDSNDWDTTTEIMKKIQSEWKNIGHVPRKYSDKLWKEFKDACNYYFDRLHQKQDEGNKEQLEVFNQKKELLKEIKDKLEKKETFNLEVIKEYIGTWRNLGRVPFEMRHIESKFNKLLDKVIDANPVDKQEVEMIKFENLMNSYIEQKNFKKLDSEQIFVRKKIDETLREIHQLENNIGFISNVTEENPLVMNVRDHIDEYKEKLEIWKAKLEFLRQLEY